MAMLIFASWNSRAIADDADTKRATLETQAESGDAKQAAIALFDLAEMDEHDYRFASALARYDASVARDPSHRYALRARAHADTLRAHSEGDFAPYSELEHVRRDRVASRDPVALAKLAQDADGFPPGQVRVEARLLVGDTLLAQGDLQKALPLLDLVDADPLTDPILHHQAAHELVDAYLLENDPEDAMKVALRPHEDPALLDTVKRSMRRTRARSGAVVVLALFVVVSGIAIARGIARGKSAGMLQAMKRFAPLAIGFAAWIAVFGGILATSYEKGNESPFIALGLAVLPIFMIARAWSAAGAESSFVKIGRAVLSAASVAAIAFVVLTYVGNGMYLAGFGL
jgi:hypothetical protein